MSVIPCGERPLASTTWAPASSARRTAAARAGVIVSSVVPAALDPATAGCRRCRARPAAGCQSAQAGASRDRRGSSTSRPPMYGTSAFGQRTDPSALLVGLQDRHDRRG